MTTTIAMHLTPIPASVTNSPSRGTREQVRIFGPAGTANCHAVALLVQGLIDEIREPFTNVGSIRDLLQHHDHRELRLRVDTVERSVGATPAERPEGLHNSRA